MFQWRLSRATAQARVITSIDDWKRASRGEWGIWGHGMGFVRTGHGKVKVVNQTATDGHGSGTGHASRRGLRGMASNHCSHHLWGQWPLALPQPFPCFPPHSAVGFPFSVPVTLAPTRACPTLQHFGAAAPGSGEEAKQRQKAEAKAKAKVGAVTGYGSSSHSRRGVYALPALV